MDGLPMNKEKMMKKYVFVFLGLLSQPLSAATKILYLDAGASIPAAVTQLGASGGTIYLAEGIYIVGAGSAQGALVIQAAPVTLVGSVDQTGAPASIIKLIPDVDTNATSQDIAIKIVDLTKGFGGDPSNDAPDLGNLDGGSNSEIRNIKIIVDPKDVCDNPETTSVVETNFNCAVSEGSAGAIELDGAEFVVINNVHIDGFGDVVTSNIYQPLAISPFAIKVHTSSAHDASTFDCADWLKIHNARLTNNYRGLVVTGCSNGYVNDTVIENTGPGAAVYIERKGTNGGASFNFLNTAIRYATSGSGTPVDKDYLVYLTHCTVGSGCDDPDLRNTNAGFMNSETDVGTASTVGHFYVNSGQNQWFNHSFKGGVDAMYATDLNGYPTNPVKNNNVGPYVMDVQSMGMHINTIKNEIWNVASDIDEDGFYASDDLDDDNDSVLDVNDAYPLISLGNYTDMDRDGRPDECDTTCQATGMSADLNDDNDAAPDISDSCSLVVNSEPLPGEEFDQSDVDNDGYGNACDGDLNNDGKVTLEDIRILVNNGLAAWVDVASGEMPVTMLPHISAELSEINQKQWLGWTKEQSYIPGPSGLSCAGSIPCPGNN
jgi:hypothetical protein